MTTKPTDLINTSALTEALAAIATTTDRSRRHHLRLLGTPEDLALVAGAVGTIPAGGEHQVEPVGPGGDRVLPAPAGIVRRERAAYP
ncbi:hypothetical protein [Streptomyces sp. NPDC058653]|uniref:hypothetical protein n=1 Tax=Streptomyces sp. NPDC058653 TaxID=3346576 RepID=UPI00364F3B30